MQRLSFTSISNTCCVQGSGSNNQLLMTYVNALTPAAAADLANACEELDANSLFRRCIPYVVDEDPRSTDAALEVAFWEAVRENDLVEVERLAESGIDLNCCDSVSVSMPRNFTLQSGGCSCIESDDLTVWTVLALRIRYPNLFQYTFFFWEIAARVNRADPCFFPLSWRLICYNLSLQLCRIYSIDWPCIKMFTIWQLLTLVARASRNLCAWWYDFIKNHISTQVAVLAF